MKTNDTRKLLDSHDLYASNLLHPVQKSKDKDH